MRFPFPNFKVSTNSSETNFLSSYEKETEIPLLPHPGAFGKERKNHNHEGVDLYCEENQEVVAMENGLIIGIHTFTGESVNTPWWNHTQCILVRGNSGVINYGEIMIDNILSVGNQVLEGQKIGNVCTVLKKFKARPMNMLHIEFYEYDTEKHITEWKVGTEKPKQLKDPTLLLLKFV